MQDFLFSESDVAQDHDQNLSTKIISTFFTAGLFCLSLLIVPINARAADTIISTTTFTPQPVGDGDTLTVTILGSIATGSSEAVFDAVDGSFITVLNSGSITSSDNIAI
ncbi:MAG: hypothetical protein GWM98_25350 [Nitrospinaceae bacterium]|nr:hypothetical protein [Nitrospinaceae bacterium]NIR57191.1 hypothetical protein [Nitrospinaceae bacterium]NIS87634.1 hypothetical protein [Nitrospinaceae bacterium]NIT84501.1 hypothetical protein [Nitrospinaceae bacterium]NIU46691.1 hypothetical protein [Nitrospinaceae bacterium]